MHAGSAEGHAGAAPPALLAHAWQTFPEQIGVAARHCELSVQFTHECEVESQCGVAGSVSQTGWLVASRHWKQVPPMQAGFVGVVHGVVPPVCPKSSSHGTQVFVVVLHAPGQAEVFPAEQATQAPFTHAGNPEVGQGLGLLAVFVEPKSPVQATQFLLASQTGKAAGQAVDVHV
jgi:hypothetical protein